MSDTIVKLKLITTFAFDNNVRHKCKIMNLGIDIGSTTVKIVILDQKRQILFSRYERHNVRIVDTVTSILDKIPSDVSESFLVGITGSIGMGISQNTGIPFVQEVVAAAKAAKLVTGRKLSSMIDIGGEDAKVVYFNEDGEPSDLRMNGNCAAGTGSFIDQMSILLNESIDTLSELALHSTHIYPIASRCGVFCKTDIQNLVAKNVSKADIAASVFHAVAVQTVVTLAHGFDITPPVLFCGGPLTAIPALREAFITYLQLRREDILIPEEGLFLPAIGAAIGAGNSYSLENLKQLISTAFRPSDKSRNAMKPIFADEAEYEEWAERIGKGKVERSGLVPGPMDVFLGVDSGSTTTKIAITDPEGRLLFQYYRPNSGDPVGTAVKGLAEFNEECRRTGTAANIIGGCSTGYGEDLLKAALRLRHGIVETIAHYIAASRLDPDVSFILDIGGQDMKAIYVDKGVINRIEINEACSSGCGSFIETFAASLQTSVGDFARAACISRNPCDLGTRCTVFMNSKVKQVLREGFGVADIAAGLALSVVRNCLYKVLKLKDTGSLGGHIVVQGGTMKNDAVVRSLEKLTGATVSRSDIPEMMGAYGCCLYAIKHQ